MKSETMMAAKMAARPWGQALGRLLVALLLVVQAGTVFAQGEKESVRAFQRAFRSSKEPLEQYEARSAALRALEGDPAEIAALLLEASATIEGEAATIEEQRSSYLGNGLSSRKLQRRESLDPLRKLQSTMRRKLLSLNDEQAVDHIVRAVLKDDKLPFSLRHALVERAQDLPDELRWKLTAKGLRSSRPATAAVALRFLSKVEKPPAEFLRVVLGLLNSRSVILRELAADALSVLRLPEGVGPLVSRLGREEGRTQERMAHALQLLTGQPIGNRPAAWEDWWADNGEQILSGELPLGDGIVQASEASAERYHGIPLDGEAILYVFDRSESMSAPLGGRFEPGGRGGGPPSGRSSGRPAGPAQDGQERRIDRAKAELIKALGTLTGGKTFNIVVFAAGSKSFGEGMLDASPRNIKRAQQWVRDIDLELATALYDGIDYGFVMGGRPVRDQLYLGDFDTMFVLTDGFPTLPLADGGGGSVGPRGGGGGGQGGGGRRGGRLARDSDDAILDAVRRWNVLDRVVIHTIGMGDRFAESFLESLAKDNGGRYVSER